MRCSYSASQPPTELTQVQAEIGPLHERAVAADGPQVEVHVHRQGGESRHAQPGQHEQVGQHDELRPRSQRERASFTGKGELRDSTTCSIRGFQCCGYDTGKGCMWQTGRSNGLCD